MEGLFHKVKIIHTTRGENKEGKKKSKKFYDKMTTLRWDPYRWRWVQGDRFFNYTTKLGRNLITKRTEGVNHAANKWQCHHLGNYKSYWYHVWDPLRFEKEAAFMWSIWHKHLQWLNGGLASHMLPFLSNVSSTYLTQVSRLNTTFGIAFKRRGFEDGPCSSCMSCACAGWGPTTTTSFIANKLCLRKDSE